MIKFNKLLVIVLFLMVGIVFGLTLSGWTNSQAAEDQGNLYSFPYPNILRREVAVGDAVPSAAHLSLWEEDFETMLPFISKGQ